MKSAESVIYFEAPKGNEDLSGGDFQQLISFLFAFCGTWLKSKISVWVSLFFLFSSFANMKNRSANYMQLIINFGLVVMGFFQIYIWIPKQMALQQQQQQG